MSDEEFERKLKASLDEMSANLAAQRHAEMMGLLKDISIGLDSVTSRLDSIEQTIRDVTARS